MIFYQSTCIFSHDCFLMTITNEYYLMYLALTVYYWENFNIILESIIPQATAKMCFKTSIIILILFNKWELPLIISATLEQEQHIAVRLCVICAAALTETFIWKKKHWSVFKPKFFLDRSLTYFEMFSSTNGNRSFEMRKFCLKFMIFETETYCVYLVTRTL